MSRVLNRGALLGIRAPDEVLGRRARALDAVDAALESVEPGRVTRAGLARLAELGVRLDGCVVFALGKAARGMAVAVLEAVSVRVGLVVGFEEGRLGPLRLIRAGHPIPLPDAAARGREVLELARSLGPDDVALCLVSGGGSAMLELPRPGFSLGDIQRRTRELLRADVAIDQLNRERASMSLLKGGGLARAMSPAKVVNLVISDVPGHGPEVVASGPTVVPEATTVVVADNTTARDAAARSLALQPDQAITRGLAAEQGRSFYLGTAPPGRAAGGETTVVVTGDGLGGRNQEFVLGAASAYSGGLLLSLGTDGVDGTSRAAGALLDGDVIRRARRLGLDPASTLASNDSDRYFAATLGRIETGPTGTNVADVHLCLRA